MSGHYQPAHRSFRNLRFSTCFGSRQRRRSLEGLILLRQQLHDRVPGSLQSSLGFYVTGDDYYGMHGKSLELNGVDSLYNEKAGLRNIVVHGAWYCSDEFIERHGRLGRSWGCPALPLEVSEEIIDAICDGTCMFVYADDDEYLENSIYLEIDGAAEEFEARRNRR